MTEQLIKETGQIVAVDDGAVIVAVVRTSACKSCQARQGCGQAVLAEWGSAEHQQTKNHFRITTDLPLKKDDLVELGMAQDTVSRVAAMVYLLPLLTAFIALVLSVSAGVSELWQLFSLIAGFIIGLVLIRKINGRYGHGLTPKILRLYPSGQGDSTIVSSRS